MDSVRLIKSQDGKVSKGLCGNTRMQHNTMFGYFFLLVMSCIMGLIYVASLFQQRDLQLQRLAVHSLHSNNETEGMMELIQPLAKEEDVGSFECVGWKAQRNCSPDGGPDPSNDRACNATVRNRESGFCVIRHKRTGELRRVMKLHCNSLRLRVTFKCDDFAVFLNYGRQSTKYVHDSNFSLEGCRQMLVEDRLHVAEGVDEKARQADESMADQPLDGIEMSRTPSSTKALEQSGKEVHAVVTPPVIYKRGISFVVYGSLLQSVYASVKSLRSLGCTLPIELWYKRSETDPMHPLLRELTSGSEIYIREIRDPRIIGYYTKPYAIYYSAFDQVLFLDADNFAVRDPTYLFNTSQFRKEGAIFWPDFWRPKKTIFNIHSTSFVWEVFGLQYVNMFEQESGQVMIDRTMHQKALNVLMYYVSNRSIFERLRLVWGDKDLFRFAWLKTNSSFHMIETPPGAAGQKLPTYKVFCGITMVQHDPEREIIFLHRNAEKLSSKYREKIWTHVQDFRIDEVQLDDYDVRGANGGKAFPKFRRCFGKDVNYEKAFTVKAIEDLPFAGLEQQLLNFAYEAARINGTQSSDSNGEASVPVASSKSIKLLEMNHS